MSNYEYGVLCRRKGSDDEWKPVTGYRNSNDAYKTLRAARSFKTIQENRSWNDRYEYTIAQRLISPWEVVD